MLYDHPKIYVPYSPTTSFLFCAVTLFQSLPIVSLRTMIFPSFMSVIDKLRPRDKLHLPFNFINKISVERSHVHLFMHCLWLLLLYNTVNSCDRHGMACKAERTIYYPILYRKSLPTLALYG